MPKTAHVWGPSLGAALFLAVSLSGGVVLAHGGGQPITGGVTSTTAHVRTAQQDAQDLASQINTGSTPNPSKIFNEGPCGSGAFLLTPGGRTSEAGSSVNSGSCPSVPSTPSTPAPAPSGLPAAFVTTTVVVPWYFNGCMPNPAVPVVTPFYMGTTLDQVAPGEPENEVRIAAPTEQKLVMPQNAPGMNPGHSVAQYAAQAAPNFWNEMTFQGATGQVIPGPGWGIESEKLQNWLHTPFWHQGAAITNSKGVVTGHQAHFVAWNVTADGPPYWTAREVNWVASCPIPIVTVTTD